MNLSDLPRRPRLILRQFAYARQRPLLEVLIVNCAFRRRGRDADLFNGAALMIDAFPKARGLLGDKGHDADWFRDALAERKIAACIPSKSNRNIPIPYDTVLHRQHHRIENMFGKLKDWRRYPHLLRTKRPHFQVRNLHRRSRLIRGAGRRSG